MNPHPGSYILKTENGSGKGGGVILSSIVLPTRLWDPPDEGDPGRMDGTQLHYCQTHKRKALQMWEQLASESMLWNNLSLKTPGCGCVNLPHATCVAKSALAEVPATPTQLHMHWAFSRIPHPLFSSGCQHRSLWLLILKGEEWVLPAGMLPLVGADRKIGRLLMSSQKPLMDKSGCIFTLSLHAARHL